MRALDIAPSPSDYAPTMLLVVIIVIVVVAVLFFVLRGSRGKRRPE